MKEWFKYNKGLMIFYIILFIFIICWCEYVERTDHIVTPQNNYYERG